MMRVNVEVSEIERERKRERIKCVESIVVRACCVG